MIQLPDYHFYLPNYTHSSNGIITLWEAAFEFGRHRNVSISTFAYGEVNCGIPTRYRKFLKEYKNKKNTIVVYPDCVEGNPLGAERVARYLMAKPYILNNTGFKYSDKEFIFAYSNAVNSNLAQYNLIDPELSKLRSYKVSKKKNRLVIYMGKCRFGIDFKKFVSLLDMFDEVVYITRTNPNNKEILYKTISESKLLLCFDPLSSICYESTLMGTPVLIGDPVFKNEYDNYNYPLSGFFYDIDDVDLNSDQFYLDATSYLDNEICMHDQKTVKILDEIERALVHKLVPLPNTKSLTKYDIDFFNSRWNASPVFNCTTRKSLYRYHLINSKPSIYIIILQLYRFKLFFSKTMSYCRRLIQNVKTLFKIVGGINSDAIYLKYSYNPSLFYIAACSSNLSDVKSNNNPPITMNKITVKILWRI